VPILKSSEKDVRRSRRRRARNLVVQSRLKTAITKVRKAKSPADGKVALKSVESLLDKAAVKGHVHKNKAARTKSRLSKAVSKIK
jgi:small subunit ribosomal protein S20